MSKRTTRRSNQLLSSYCKQKMAGAVPTDDTFRDWTLGMDQNARHVHFPSTPVKPEVSNINLNITPPTVPKEDTIVKSIL